jgi:hypothetical protein
MAKMEFQLRRGEVTFLGENFIFAREERKITTRLSEDKNLALLENRKKTEQKLTKSKIRSHPED